MRTIGFFGGTFDPLHFGHLNLAIQLFEIHRLDEVLFCPAFCSPFKTEAPPVASPEQRLQMVRLALDGIPHFQITPIEIERGRLSYTIDTLRSLQTENTTFRLLLSSEAAAHFSAWKEAKELLHLAPPLIGMRHDERKSLEEFPLEKKEILRSGKGRQVSCRKRVESSPEMPVQGPFARLLKKGVTPTHVMEISSTEVRERLKKGGYCGHLVPAKVLDYISRHRLYS